MRETSVGIDTLTTTNTPITTSNCLDYSPWNVYSFGPYYVPQPQIPTWVYATGPVQTECIGDIHVFPCPHCDSCKCGQAQLKKKKK